MYGVCDVLILNCSLKENRSMNEKFLYLVPKKE